MLIEEGVRIAIIVTGSPEVYTARLKQAGVFVIHAVASVKHAQKAEGCGVDAVVAEGFDAGGHSGFDEIPTASLVPQVAQACAIPVIAAGGIVDGRGLVAQLGYGAQAVYMGTRFMATVECPIHDRVKQAIVAAIDTGSTSWGRSTEIARTLKNRFTEEYRKRELSGATREELHKFIADYTKLPGGRRVAGLRGGDLDDGEVYLGTGVGLVRDVVTCAEVIRRTMDEARQTLDRVGAILRGEDRPQPRRSAVRMTMRNRVAVIGVGTTAAGTMPGHDAYDLGLMAFKRAMEDCGIRRSQIDGLIVNRIPDYQRFAEIAGMDPQFALVTPGQGRMSGDRSRSPPRRSRPGSPTRSRWSTATTAGRPATSMAARTTATAAAGSGLGFPTA